LARSRQRDGTPASNTVDNEHQRIHARELDLPPDLRLLPRHPRPLLRGVEQAHRSALAHHVHRTARLGLPVLITRTWYDTSSAPLSTVCSSPRADLVMSF